MAEKVAFDFFHSKKLHDLVDRQVTTLSPKQTVEEAVNILAKGKLHSAPLVESDGKCLGIIDILDIVAFVLSVAPDPLSLAENELRSLEISGRAMAFKQLSEIANLSGRNPFLPVYEDDPATHALSLFAQGVHRVPLLDRSGKVTGNISQSTLLKLLAENLHQGKLKELGAKAATELKLLSSPVVFSVKKTDTVLQALQAVQQNGVSAVALVEEDGKLAGNFSAMDLIGLYREDFPSFLLSVEDYLTKHSPQSLNSVVCRAESTLLEITQEIAKAKVHRIWVVDDDYKPKGIISITDIMRLANEYTQ